MLDLLFKRYTNFDLDCEEDEEVKNTICTLLHSWIDEFSEDFSKT